MDGREGGKKYKSYVDDPSKTIPVRSYNRHRHVYEMDDRELEAGGIDGLMADRVTSESESEIGREDVDKGEDRDGDGDGDGDDDGDSDEEIDDDTDDFQGCEDMLRSEQRVRSEEDDCDRTEDDVDDCQDRKRMRRDTAGSDISKTYKSCLDEIDTEVESDDGSVEDEESDDESVDEEESDDDSVEGEESDHESIEDEGRRGLENESTEGESDDENEKKDEFEVFPESGENFIFLGSLLTLGKAVTLLMVFFLKHKCSKSLLKDLLQLLDLFLPKGHRFPTSLHKLFQFAGPTEGTKHFYKKKIRYTGKTKKKVKFDVTYIGTKPPKKEEKLDTHFFYELDVKSQILHLFDNRRLGEKIENPEPDESGIIRDIVDGTEYKRANKDRKEFDITLQINTDGIRLSNSSGSHCWPIMAKICELPSIIRDSYTIMLGLWCDSVKPDMDVFFRPICQSIAKQIQTGITWYNNISKSEVISKILCPLFVGDSPARADVQNIQHCNGRYGCNICELKTVRSKKVQGEKRVRIYPFREIKDLKLRTKKRMKKQARLAPNRKRKHKTGVKGNSAASDLPGIDISTAFPPEYMHSVLIGVVKQMITWWLTKPGAWSLSAFVSDIDAELLQIKPPDIFSRLPRRITEYALYKASEFYCFLLFYSVIVLQKFLPAEHFQHWTCLVMAIHTLSKSEITESDLQKAESLLEDFVRHLERLYGDRALTYNVHMLLHLPLCVRRWGPLWAWSTFHFEHLNGVIAHMSHATFNIIQEIINNICIVKNVDILKNLYLESSSYDYESSCMGKEKPIQTLTLEETKFLRDKNTINLSEVQVFFKASLGNKTYTCLKYKTLKTNSFNVQVEFNNTKFYGEISFFFIKKNDPGIYCVLKMLKVEHSKMITHEKLSNEMKTVVQIKHILPVVSTGELKLLKLGDVRLRHLIRIGCFVCRPNWDSCDAK